MGTFKIGERGYRPTDGIHLRIYDEFQAESVHQPAVGRCAWQQYIHIGWYFLNWLSINTFIKYLVVLFFYALMVTRVHACIRVNRTQKYYTQVLKLYINQH